MQPLGRIALCTFVLLVAGLPAGSALATTSGKHQLSTYKAEEQVSIPAGQTVQPTVSCNGNDIATDGMWRIDDVQYNAQLATPGNGPFDLHNGVTVSQSQSTAVGTYTFTLRNNSENQAQAKIFVTCLGEHTASGSHQHGFVTTTVTHNYTGRQSEDFVSTPSDYACPAGSIFIAPSWKVTGDAESFASYPSNANLREWTFGFYVQATSTDIEVGGRCLSRASSVAHGHHHNLSTQLRQGPVQSSHKGNDVYEHQINCGDDQKGMVGGYDLSNTAAGWHWNTNHDSHWLGMDPRPKTRAYKTLGADPRHLYLVCFNDRTS